MYNVVYKYKGVFNGHHVALYYTGRYPNLCRGQLFVVVDGTHRYLFGKALVSRGCVLFDDDWRDTVVQRDWDVVFPKNFPDRYKVSVENAVNGLIPHGCCGGCV